MAEQEQANEENDEIIDSGRVIIMVGDPTKGTAMPVPLPAVFEQLFAILGDLDRRLMELEGTAPKKSGLITL